MKIHIPEVLSKYADNKSLHELEEQVDTIDDVLAYLTSTFPKLKKIFYSDDKLSRYINIFVNETNIKNSNGVETALKNSDEVIIIQALAGG